ncbi:MAG TPA: ATP-binding protein [Acidobacteriaceae bacterium]|jgi:PAS domain S-box-containing protein
MFENDPAGSDSQAKKDSLAAELDAMQRLYDFSTRLLGTKDVSIIMGDLLQSVLAVQSADLEEIHLYNSNDDSLDLVASAGLRPAIPTGYGGLYDSGSPAWLAMLSGQRLVMEDVLRDVRFVPYREVAAARGFRSVHFTPMLNRLGGPIGVMSAYFPGPRPSPGSESRLIELYARHATEAIGHRRSLESQRKLASVVENSMDFVGLASLDGHAEILNRAGREMVGLDHLAAVRDTRIEDYIAEEDRKDLLPLVLSTVMREGKWQGEIRFRHFKTGEIIPMLQHTFIVRDEVSGSPVALGTIARDMRQKEKVAQALQEARAELAHIARVNTLGQLITAIAHEISQPLSAVVNSGLAGLNWLRHSPPNLEEARDSFEAILREGHRGADVLNRIRNLAKRGPPRFEPVNLPQLVGDVILLTREDLERHGIRVEIELEPDIPAIVGDPVQLQQVLLNLILNAVDAMSQRPAGDRDLRLTLTRQSKHTVVIGVQDSGTGFDPGSADRLFAPFFTTKPGGLGMGLTISRSIVEAHGGRLWAAPNPAGGTVFYFSLPLQYPSLT